MMAKRRQYHILVDRFLSLSNFSSMMMPMSCKVFLATQKDSWTKSIITSGFWDLLTLGVDMDAVETMTHYALRTEQENEFEQWKSQMSCNRDRISSEGGKAETKFIHFVGKY